MKLTAQELKEIRERAEKASPGPWYSRMLGGGKGGPNVYSIRGEFGDGTLDHIARTERHNGRSAGHDGEFIAHSRADIPSLLDHIAALEQEKVEIEARTWDKAWRFIEDNVWDTVSVRSLILDFKARAAASEKSAKRVEGER